MTTFTHDSISLRGAGVVTITQPARGHRFTIDSVLLADFCRIKPRDRILEPGAGSGIISILLARKFPASRITAVEIQHASVELCRSNTSENNLQDRITVIEGDISKLRKALAAEAFDAIVANPPYTRQGTGRRSPLQERHAARYDLSAGVETWLDLRAFLKNRGRYFLVFPAQRLVELFSSLRAKRLEPKRVRLVHSHKDKSASLALIEAVKAAGAGLEILPPLIVREQEGVYSGEVREIYGLPASSDPQSK